ncbi:MAG: hypothetical protein DHS80DRAFT_32501 [Piptocephalis tieghemiana]|nr:MAG: hypothetical protein DHS80DRAFT_32501 [Piptocephalis tieghemiana]
MLSDLPSEILEGILRLLDIEALLALSRTCKRFRDLVFSSVQQGHTPFWIPFHSENLASPTHYQRFPWVFARLRPRLLLLEDGSFLDYLPTQTFFPRASLSEIFPPFRYLKVTHPRYVLGEFRNRTTLTHPPGRLWSYLQGPGIQELQYLSLEGWNLGKGITISREKHSPHYPLKTLSLSGCNVHPDLLVDLIIHHGSHLEHLYLADCLIPSIAGAQSSLLVLSAILLRSNANHALRTLWIDPITQWFPDSRLQGFLRQCTGLHELRLGRLSGEKPEEIISMATSAPCTLKELKLMTCRHAFTIFPMGRIAMRGLLLMLPEEWFKFLGALQDYFSSLFSLSLGILSLPSVHALMRTLPPSDTFTLHPLDHLCITGINRVSEMPGEVDVGTWGYYMTNSTLKTITLKDMPWLEMDLLHQWAKDFSLGPPVLRRLRLGGTSIRSEDLQTPFWISLPVQVILCEERV